MLFRTFSSINCVLIATVTCQTKYFEYFNKTLLFAIGDYMYLL